MTNTAETEYDKTRRWLLDQAERTVTANGSKATFVSDCLFDGANAISSLLADKKRLTRELSEAKKRLEELGDF